MCMFVCSTLYVCEFLPVDAGENVCCTVRLDFCGGWFVFVHISHPFIDRSILMTCFPQFRLFHFLTALKNPKVLFLFILILFKFLALRNKSE